jgi:hypothetical protein
MNGGVLRGRPRPGRGCSAIDGWNDSYWLITGDKFYRRVWKKWKQVSNGKEICFEERRAQATRKPKIDAVKSRDTGNIN